MKSWAFFVLTAAVILSGCSKKEDYHAHETETFNMVKMATYKKLSALRSVLKDSRWTEQEEKENPKECQNRLNRAVAAAKNIEEINKDFGFACKSLSCHGECKFHFKQMSYVELVYMCANGLSEWLSLTQNRKTLEDSINVIDNALAMLENPEKTPIAKKK